MGALKYLTEEYATIDTNFLQFCASHGIFSVEDFLVHDVRMLVASAEQLSNSDTLKQDVTGGLREGHVTELVGPSSSGKTQVCFQVASNVAMKLGGVVYLDSGNSFSPTRVKQIVTRISGSVENQVNGNLQKALRNIECHAVFDIYALLNVLHQLKSNLEFQAGYKVRLIIIDSISSLIAPILGGNNAQGHALMVSVGYMLKKLADRHNIAVVVTNHMVSGEGGNLKPALGESWKNIPHVQLQFSRDHATNIYGVYILKHPYMASGGSANFMIP